MSAALTIAIIIACIAGYGFMTGLTYAILRSHGEGDSDASAAAAVWPFSLPAIGGAAMVRRMKARRIPRAIVTKEPTP